MFKIIKFCRGYIKIIYILRIKNQFSIARTPQQNVVSKRKNKIIHEMTRAMLKYSKLGYVFWVQEVHIAVHIQNRGMFIRNNDKTPYELRTGRLENVNHFRIFGSK